MKKNFLLLCLSLSLLQLKAQNSDFDVAIITLAPSVNKGNTAILAIRTCNNGDPAIVANSFKIRVNMPSALEVIGIGAGSDSRFTLLNPITPGSGNFAEIANSNGGLDVALPGVNNAPCADIYLVVKGNALVTAGEPNSIITADASFLPGNNPLLSGAANSSQGNDPGDDHSETSLGVLNTLPVTLSNFTAIKSGSQVLLNWDFIADSQFSYFELEKSNDALSFASLDNRQYTPVSIGALHFNAADNKPASGANYYRLKMVEKDGSFNYSQILKVNFSGSNAMVSVYPNPAVNAITVDAPALQNNSRIKIYDVFGKLVLQTAASAITQVNLQSLTTGTYMLEALNANGERKGLVKFLKATK